MGCKCIFCVECKGSGTVWYSFTGEFLGNNRCDDLDDFETCPECNGSGKSFMCSECIEEDEDEELDW